MSPRPRRKSPLYHVELLRDRYVPNVPVPLLALLAIAIIALIATGIGWLIYRS